MVGLGRLFVLLVLSVLGGGRTAAADETCASTGTCGSGGGGGGAQDAVAAARAQAAADKAQAAVDKALRYGSGLARRGRREEAAAQFEKVVAFRPTGAEAHFRLGLARNELYAAAFMRQVGGGGGAAAATTSKAQADAKAQEARAARRLAKSALAAYERAIALGQQDGAVGWGDGVGRASGSSGGGGSSSQLQARLNSANLLHALGLSMGGGGGGVSGGGGAKKAKRKAKLMVRELGHLHSAVALAPASAAAAAQLAASLLRTATTTTTTAASDDEEGCSGGSGAPCAAVRHVAAAAREAGVPRPTVAAAAAAYGAAVRLSPDAAAPLCALAVLQLQRAAAMQQQQQQQQQQQSTAAAAATAAALAAAAITAAAALRKEAEELFERCLGTAAPAPLPPPPPPSAPTSDARKHAAATARAQAARTQWCQQRFTAGLGTTVAAPALAARALRAALACAGGDSGGGGGIGGGGGGGGGGGKGSLAQLPPALAAQVVTAYYALGRLLRLSGDAGGERALYRSAVGRGVWQHELQRPGFLAGPLRRDGPTQPWTNLQLGDGRGGGGGAGGAAEAMKVLQKAAPAIRREVMASLAGAAGLGAFGEAAVADAEGLASNGGADWMQVVFVKDGVPTAGAAAAAAAGKDDGRAPLAERFPATMAVIEALRKLEAGRWSSPSCAQARRSLRTAAPPTTGCGCTSGCSCRRCATAAAPPSPWRARRGAGRRGACSRSMTRGSTRCRTLRPPRVWCSLWTCGSRG